MNEIIRFRRQRTLGNLVLRWTVLLFIGLLIVMPVYLHGGDWVPLVIIAVVFLLTCVPVLGLDLFAAQKLEFENRQVRITCGSQILEYPLGRIEVTKPLWLQILKGRGLLLRASTAKGFVLLLAEEDDLKRAVIEFRKRGVSLNRENS